MKIVLSIVLMMPAILNAKAQAEHAGMRLDDIWRRIDAVESENRSLKAAMRAKDSITYCSARFEIFTAFTGAAKLDFDFKNTKEKIAVTGLFTKLMQANNPTSDILGFRFNEIIFSACEKHFLSDIKEEKDKNRFIQVISKIVSNPVVSTLASTNPVTSVVAAIINTLAGFTTSVVELKKDGNRIREVRVGDEDIFDREGISAFRNELQVYINFYDALIIASQNYLSGLENLDAKYAYLIQSVKAYQSNLMDIAGKEDGNILIGLATMFPDPANRAIDFAVLLSDPGIVRAISEARKFPALQQSVSEFQKEYNAILFRFLQDYILTLETGCDFPADIVDQSRIDSLIGEINHFIDSQKGSENEVPDVFGTR